MSRGRKTRMGLYPTSLALHWWWQPSVSQALRNEELQCPLQAPIILCSQSYQIIYSRSLSQTHKMMLSGMGGGFLFPIGLPISLQKPIKVHIGLYVGKWVGSNGQRTLGEFWTLWEQCSLSAHETSSECFSGSRSALPIRSML